MKKIMFNDRYGLTQAVLSGRKTMTRRLASKFIPDAMQIGFERLEIFGGRELRLYNGGKDFIKFNLPYKVGEVVAIAQSYKDLGYHPAALDRSPKDWRVVRGILGQSKGWNNKMFVRADACQNHIRITNIRVEKFQDISDEDCIKEGIVKWTKDRVLFKYDLADGFEIFEWSDKPRTPREAFAALIDRISGKGTWDSNLFVFVYEFELVK